MSSELEEKIRCDGETCEAESEPEVHFEPVVTLPLVEVPTFEENEEELCRVRARLYRYDVNDHEWKERGTGDIKLLRHKENNSVRVVMRRDKTLKLCANHFITPDIRMNVHCGSDRAFNWSVFADFADETAKQELLAIKFGNVQNAELWKSKFAEAQEIVRTKCIIYTEDSDSSDEEDSLTRSDEATPQDCTEAHSDGVVLQLKQLSVEDADKETGEKE